MSQHERRLLESWHAMVNVVQVGVTHATARYFDQDLARAGSWGWYFFHNQRLIRGMKNSGFHGCFSSNAWRKWSGTRIFWNVLRSAITTVISPFAVRQLFVSLKI